jgi:hypothetical protein
MTSLPIPLTIAVPSDKLEFRFLWNAAEHRRLYRAVARATGRRRVYRRLLAIVVALIALAEGWVLATSRVPLSSVASASVPYLVLIVMWVAFISGGLPYISARDYARNHQRCIPHDQIRIVSADGIEANCVTTNVRIQWAGITRVVEGPEFFLIFTGPACAFAIPKRAVPDAERLGALRGTLTRALGSKAELLAA